MSTQVIFPDYCDLKCMTKMHDLELDSVTGDLPLCAPTPTCSALALAPAPAHFPGGEGALIPSQEKRGVVLTCRGSSPSG